MNRQRCPHCGSRKGWVVVRLWSADGCVYVTDDSIDISEIDEESLRMSREAISHYLDICKNCHEVIS